MLVVSAVAVLALGGCGGDDKIDAGKAEQYVRDTARAPQLIDDVICPEDLKAKTGRTFECKILVKDGSEEVVTIRQTDDDVHIEIAGNRQTKPPRDQSDFRILPENVEDLIRASAEEREDIVSVDCPADVKVREGNDFECSARLDDGSERVYEIHQRDDLGNVELAGSREKR